MTNNPSFIIIPSWIWNA